MPNSCFCCCENKLEYLKKKEEKFGKDVVNHFMFEIDFEGRRSMGELKPSANYFLDVKSPEFKDGHNRYTEFYRDMREDKKRFCKHEIGCTVEKIYEYLFKQQIRLLSSKVN